MGAFLADSWLALLLTAVAGYLLGSVNWAIIVTKAFSRKDIRSVGSGNAGATNVLRSQGTLPAVLTSVGDVGKGLLASLLGGWLVAHLHMTGEASLLPQGMLVTDIAVTCRIIGQYIGGFFCVMGHLFPVFYQFRGGKGVLTTLGMLFVVDWRVALLGLTVFGVVVGASRMVSLGSMAAACALPILTLVLRLWADRYPVGATIFCTAVIALIGIIVIWKHRGNIRRIMSGTERRLGQDKV